MGRDGTHHRRNSGGRGLAKGRSSLWNFVAKFGYFDANWDAVSCPQKYWICVMWRCGFLGVWGAPVPYWLYWGPACPLLFNADEFLIFINGTLAA